MYKFTDEELRTAKSVDLVELAAAMQIPIKKKGRYHCAEEMDSLIIFNRTTWYRYSRGVGGSSIDFVMYFQNLTFREAVSYLLDFAGYTKKGNAVPVLHGGQKAKMELSENRGTENKVPFLLPEKSPDSRRMYAYLMKQRGLSKEIIRYWQEKEMMYESLPYHNIVFLGRDISGKVRFASQRGTQDAYGKPFKGDVPGNDKRYGVNIVNLQNQEVNVYEAAIDAMSDMDLRQDFETNILVLGMVSDGPLKTFLGEYPHIKKISFCLDNDLPGREAAKKLSEKYARAGYDVSVRFPPFGKDYNEFLQKERENKNLRMPPHGSKTR